MKTFESAAPIVRPEDDVLHRLPSAQWLAGKILEQSNGEEPADSVAIGITGAWGSGKTSFLNLVQYELEAAGDDFPVVGDIAKIAAEFTKERGDALSSRARLSDQDLDALKKGVCDALNDSDQRVVVMLDDIDRLSSQEIVDIVRLVRSVADFPNTVYLLAFDRLVVEAALSDFQKGSRASYIDKLLQLTVDLPEASRSVAHDFVLRFLKDIIENAPMRDGEQYRWNQFRFGILPELFPSLRDAKRFINSFRYSHGVLGGEVSIIDQICLEIVRQHQPALFRTISDTLPLWVSDELDSQHDQQNTSGIKSILDGQPDHISLS